MFSILISAPSLSVQTIWQFVETNVSGPTKLCWAATESVQFVFRQFILRAKYRTNSLVASAGSFFLLCHSSVAFRFRVHDQAWVPFVCFSLIGSCPFSRTRSCLATFTSYCPALFLWHGRETWLSFSILCSSVARFHLGLWICYVRVHVIILFGSW